MGAAGKATQHWARSISAARGRRQGYTHYKGVQRSPVSEDTSRSSLEAEARAVEQVFDEAPVEGASSVDIEELVDRVYELLTQDMRMECERRGQE